jgi:hypothetical protein
LGVEHGVGVWIVMQARAVGTELARPAIHTQHAGACTYTAVECVE